MRSCPSMGHVLPNGLRGTFWPRATVACCAFRVSKKGVSYILVVPAALVSFLMTRHRYGAMYGVVLFVYPRRPWAVRRFGLAASSVRTESFRPGPPACHRLPISRAQEGRFQQLVSLVARLALITSGSGRGRCTYFWGTRVAQPAFANRSSRAHTGFTFQ